MTFKLNISIFSYFIVTPPPGSGSAVPKFWMKSYKCESKVLMFMFKKILKRMLLQLLKKCQ